MSRKLTTLDEFVGVFKVKEDLGMQMYGDSQRLRRVAILECPHCCKDFTILIESAKKNKSCGCRSSELKGKSSTSHGFSKTRIYGIWRGMRSRVNSPKNDYEKEVYGKLYVAEIWNDFLEFKKWSDVNGYADDLQIDRIDNLKGYEPSNCRWITKAENTQNRLKGRRNRELPKGVKKSQNGKFQAKIQFEKQVFNLGTYSTIDGAVNAYNRFVIDNGLEDSYPLSTK